MICLHLYNLLQAVLRVYVQPEDGSPFVIKSEKQRLPKLNGLSYYLRSGRLSSGVGSINLLPHDRFPQGVSTGVINCYV